MVSQRFLVGCCGLLLLASSPRAADKDAAQLRQKFDKIDHNKDGFLDLKELAHAERGARADPAPKWVYDAKGKKVVRAFVMAKHYYPDVILLWSRDTDGDERVSWDEYLQYENNYREAAAQNAQLSRRREELRLALENRQNGPQAANNFSPTLLTAPGGPNPLLAPPPAAASPLLKPPSLPLASASGAPNLATQVSRQLAQANFSPQQMLAMSDLTPEQKRRFDTFVANFDRTYYPLFRARGGALGWHIHYITYAYGQYKQAAIQRFLNTLRARHQALVSP